MREQGSTDLAVDIRYDGRALLRGKRHRCQASTSQRNLRGGGQRHDAAWDVCLLDRRARGILSEDQWYRVHGGTADSTLLTAVFADSAKVAPEVRLGSADGRQVISARASVVVDGRDMGTELHDVCGQKHVTPTCEYNASNAVSTIGESSLDKHYTRKPPGDTIEYEAVAGEAPIAVLVEYGQVNVSAARADDPEKKYKLVEWRKSDDS